MDESIPDRLDAGSAEFESAFGSVGLTAVTAVDADRTFERELVASTFHHLPFAQLGAEQAALLIDQQFQMQENAYRAHFPASLRLIVHRCHTPVARLWLHADHGELRIVDVIVAPERRNTGIGASLVSAVLHLATRRRVPARLSVSVNNHGAQRLYERHGFTALSSDGAIIDMQATP